MKRRNYKFYIRKTHRYLGVFIGIQFLFWTLGGLYFSWTNIKEIRGDHLRKTHQTINFGQNFISPTAAIEEVKKSGNEINSVRLIEIAGESFYEINCETKIFAASALDGKMRRNISEAEAKRIAADALKEPANVKTIEYLTKENVGAHHEYREKPLPAWAVTFDTAEDLTIYLSAESGQIGALRTNSWRVFDFLWMLHTLGFEDRDNINNYFLRVFSLLGIVTIFSGFTLFFVSSRIFKRQRGD